MANFIILALDTKNGNTYIIHIEMIVQNIYYYSLNFDEFYTYVSIYKQI